MLYVAARLLDIVLAPSTLLLLICVAGLALSYWHKHGWGTRLLAIGVGGYVAIALFPIGTWLLRPLEDRFPPPLPLPEKVDGIISLGGAFNLGLTQSRGRPALNDSAARMTDFAALARRYPHVLLVFAGGNGELIAGPITEAEVARVFYSELGIDPRRIQFENRSRNTHENAVEAFRLVHPKPRQRWLLVTTAADLPRAVGAFRTAGWNVIPVPADYHTPVSGGWMPGLIRGLRNTDWAVHEWIGLIYYRLRGWTPTLLPGPEK